MTAVRARDAGLTLRAQLLIYPVVDYSIEGAYPSRIELAEATSLRWTIWRGSGSNMRDTVRQSITPTCRLFTQISPDCRLRLWLPPNTTRYAMKRAVRPALTAAGVSAEPIRAPGMIHGFFDLGGISPAAAALVKQCTESLRACCTNFARSVPDCLMALRLYKEN